MPMMTACLRQTSSTDSPPSASFKIDTAYFSVNRDFLIVTSWA